MSHGQLCQQLRLMFGLDLVASGTKIPGRRQGTSVICIPKVASDQIRPAGSAVTVFSILVLNHRVLIYP